VGDMLPEKTSLGVKLKNLEVKHFQVFHLKISDTFENRVVLTHGGKTNAHFNER